MSTGHITTLPGSRVPLKFAYSIFFVQEIDGHDEQVNSCLALKATKTWRGNILVVKRGSRKAVINMEREDAFLVDNIVSK
jgi:hypothetical protein